MKRRGSRRLSIEQVEARLPLAAHFAARPTLPGLSINNVEVSEGSAGTKTANLTVTLSSASSSSVSVSYRTADGSAKAGVDYSAVGGQLVFRPGETSKTISVPIKSDLQVEGDESFWVRLTSARSARISDGTGVVTIHNDTAVVPPTSPVDPPSSTPTAAKLLFNNDFSSLAEMNAGFKTQPQWDAPGLKWATPANGEEFEWYVNTQAGNTSPSPFSVTNGVLAITARPTSDLPQVAGESPRTYSSGILASDFSFVHGYVKARMKLPSGSGFWPALWMLQDKTQAWPPEIDIAEFSSRYPKEVLGNVLSGTASDIKNLDTMGMDHSMTSPTSFAADFHTFGFEWTATTMTWYLDGQKAFSVATPAGYDKPMYVLLNLAVGDNGEWVGPPDGSTQSLYVDYLRVWDKKP